MTNLECITGANVTPESWNRTLEGSAHGTFYQSWEFLSASGHKARELVMLLFRKEKAFIGGFAGELIEGPGGAELRAPFAASFGAFFHRPEVSLPDLHGMIECAENHAWSHGIRKITVTQPPAVYTSPVDERTEFALRRSGYRPEMTELTLYLTSLDDCSSALRRNVRKASREDLSLAETEDALETGRFVKEQKERRGLPLSVGPEELARLREALGGRVRLFLARGSDGRTAAALVAYQLTERAYLGFNWAHDEAYESARPADFILYKAAERLFHEGARVFDLGTTTRSGEPDWGITRFKEKFGARGALRTRYVKGLTPSS